MKTVGLNNTIYPKGAEPLDSRTRIDGAASDEAKYIAYPYVDMEFYSVADGKRYKVTSLDENGDIDGYEEVGTGSNSNIDVQGGNNRIVIKDNNKSYFIPMTELIKPEYPTIEETEYEVVGNVLQVTVTNHTEGARIQYKIGTAALWSPSLVGIIPIQTGFSNDEDNEVIEKKIYLKAILNGVESDTNEVTITITPKVAAPGLSVERNNNDNNWSTQATITFTPSASKDATSSYSTDSGENWTEFTEDHTLTVSETTAADKFQVKATKDGYADADVIKNSAFTLNAKKFYYGRGGETLNSEEDIKSLKGGGSKEQSIMAGSYEIQSPTSGLYTWFCGTGTLAKVTASGFNVPMEQVKSVGVYNCYRSTSPVHETTKDTFTVS